MADTLTISGTDYMNRLEQVVTEVIAPAAVEIDETGTFPRAAMEAVGKAGWLGLSRAEGVGGLGQGHRAAAMAVERVARECASTAMVLCMHYAGTAVIEAHGPREVREEIAGGRHITTLAFSEAGSRSHFWSPMSTATSADGNGKVELHARKSWATSAGEADSYVWSSRPLGADGASTIWLVAGKSDGLSVPAPFNGLGMRGNSSSPLTADGVVIEKAMMLGPDGGGFDIMMGIVL